MAAIAVFDSYAPTVAHDVGDDTTVHAPSFASGYELGEELGRGGMGEVIKARDLRIGRDVAMKRMIDTSSGTTHFLREARIQARLEHPSIVPVHELGIDENGRAFFTMKRLCGVTLQRIIATAPRNQLLRAFVDVCRAIDFAHSRNVVHRDLKPANVMLGDFGEVYVLDWGIARMTDEVLDAEALETNDTTIVGQIVGTPGYMAPEQVSGELVGPAADIYSLGAILFEILTHQRLHPTNPIATTLQSPQHSPITRAPSTSIPLELDAVCFEALSAEPSRRPTARDLADRVQAYLDGDRDIEQRRVLAARYLDDARAALARHDRSGAIHTAGRALALDPSSPDAADFLSRLLLEPPPTISPDLAAHIASEERAASRFRSRKAVIGFAASLTLAPLVFFMEVRSWPLLFAFFCAPILMGVLSYLSYRRGHTSLPLTFAGTLILVAACSRLASPFVLTPIMTCGVLLTLALIPAVQRRLWLVIAWVLAANAVPFLLELVVPTFGWTNGDLVIRSAIVGGSDNVRAVGLVIANILFVTIVALFALAISREREDARHRLRLQAWHFEQLLPRR